MKLLAGLVVQPFLAGGLAFFGFHVFLIDGNGRTLAGGVPSDLTDAAVSVAFGTGLVALLVTVVGVLPTAVFLTKRRQLSLREALLFGLGFGNLPYVLLAVAAGGTYGLAGLVRGVAFSSLLGLAGATVFWAIALRRQAASQAV
jgi:hypothetical protein